MSAPAVEFDLSHEAMAARLAAARSRLAGVARRTPALTCRTLDDLTHARVVLKCENFQRMGAFKFRGAWNTMSQIPANVRSRGVAAFSSGNHAQAVALAALMSGASASAPVGSITIFMRVSANRIASIRARSGTVTTSDA